MLTFDMLDDPIIVLHEDGRIIYCNHAATRSCAASEGDRNRFAASARAGRAVGRVPEDSARLSSTIGLVGA